MVTIYDNIDSSSGRSTTTRLLTQMIISGVVIIVVIGLMMKFYIGGIQGALDAKKKVELTSVYNILVLYYLAEGVAPVNHSTEKHCIIGTLYDSKKCLRELSRDGYGSPPISPDQEPYYYYDDEERFYVATILKKESPRTNKCSRRNKPKPVV